MANIKKFNDSKNLCGSIIKEARESKDLKKTELSKKLELHGVYLDRNEIYLLENNQILIKDFELIAIAKVLDIDLNELKKLID